MKTLTTCQKRLHALMQQHAHLRVNGAIASERTRRVAYEVLPPIFELLHERGYKLEDPSNIGNRHIAVLAKSWYEAKLAPKTMQTYLSQLRVFSRWIGKDGLVKPITYYLPDVPPEELKVPTNAKESKSWAEADIDVLQKVELAMQLDPRFGLMLMVQVSFGLRRMEVLQMKPWKCDNKDKFAVYKTKGGRPRDVYIETDAQRAVLDLIKSRVKKHEHLGWVERTDGGRASLEYSERRYNHLMQRLGITKELAGVTGHGLRSQFAENAGLLKGLIPPTLGGTAGQMPPDDIYVARAQVSESLGHSRVSITGAYWGTFGRHAAPDAPDRAVKIINAAMEAINVAPSATIPTDRMLDCMKLSNDLIAAGIYGADVRKVEVLWERHSRRHATEWLKPSDGSNLAALEVAATSILEMNGPDAAAEGTQ
jgi:integrase